MRLIIIVLCGGYAEFSIFIKSRFPYLSRGLDITRQFHPIYDIDSLDKVLSIERNMPCITLNGWHRLSPSFRELASTKLDAWKKVVHIELKQVDVTAKLDRPNS